MIPSRPLRFTEIVGQSLSIYGKSFTRILALVLICFLPALILITWGTTSLIERSVVTAERYGGFDNRDLNYFRVRIRQFEEQQPGLMEELEKQKTAESNQSTIAPSDSLTKGYSRNSQFFGKILIAHIDELAGVLSWILVALLLLIIGISILVTSVIELAAQIFEERPLDIMSALRNSFRRSAWALIAQQFILLVAAMILSLFVDVLPSPVDLIVANILSMFQIYYLIRLSVAMASLVVEELGPIQSMVRSWKLVQNNWGRVLVLHLGMGLFILGSCFVIAIILSLFELGSAATWWREFLVVPAMTIPQFLTGMTSFIHSTVLLYAIPLTIFILIYPIFLTVLSYDLRTRQEGPLTYSEEHMTAAPSNTLLWRP